MANKTLRAAKPGPITLTGKIPGMTIEVTIVDQNDTAEIEVSTRDADGVAVEVVNDAIIRPTIDGLYVETEQVNVTSVNGQVFITRGDCGVTVINSGGGAFISGSNHGSIQVGRNSGVVIGNMRAGNVSFGNGGMQINNFGSDVHVSGGGATVTSGIRITARLPRGSSIDIAGGVAASQGELDTVKVTGENEDVQLPGTTSEVEVELRNGSVSIGTAAEIEVSTHNGGINVRRVTGRADLDTHNGSITVTGDDNVPVKAKSHNGSIFHGRNLRIRPRTHNGSVRAI